LITAAEEMCPEKDNVFKQTSLTANTVARRIEDIGET